MVIANIPTPVELVITQVGDHVKIRLISHPATRRRGDVVLTYLCSSQ